MDAVVVGLLAALALALGTALWYLMVRPDVLLQIFSEGAATRDGWFEADPGSVSAMRWMLGATLFLLGFLTGLATAFLSSTA